MGNRSIVQAYLSYLFRHGEWCVFTNFWPIVGQGHRGTGAPSHSPDPTSSKMAPKYQDHFPRTTIYGGLPIAMITEGYCNVLHIKGNIGNMFRISKIGHTPETWLNYGWYMANIPQSWLIHRGPVSTSLGLVQNVTQFIKLATPRYLAAGGKNAEWLYYIYIYHYI